MNNEKRTYTYYPGCSLEGLSKEYDLSLQAVSEALGIELEELEDWNCCGATSLVAVDDLFSVLAPARSLAMAGELGRDLVVACNSCYLVLTKTLKKYRDDPVLREKVDAGLAKIGRTFNPELRVRHLLDVIVEDLGIDKIREKVTRPLNGIRLAPYYGCQAARPYGPSHPTHLDDLLVAMGADVAKWDSDTRCCGSSVLLSLEMEGLKLARDILADAASHQVDGIAVMCPLCQINLDAYQSQVNSRFTESFHIPVLYFTQLLGLALEIDPSRLGFGRLITSPGSLLNKYHSRPEVAAS